MRVGRYPFKRLPCSKTVLAAEPILQAGVIDSFLLPILSLQIYSLFSTPQIGIMCSQDRFMVKLLIIINDSFRAVRQSNPKFRGYRKTAENKNYQFISQGVYINKRNIFSNIQIWHSICSIVVLPDTIRIWRRLCVYKRNW